MRLKSYVVSIALILVLFTPVSSFAEQIKIACVGDSITAGYGAKDRETQSYPAQLQNLLGKKYEVKNCGTPGIRMANYLNNPKADWQTEIKAFQPNIVTIKLGTNDLKMLKVYDSANRAKFAETYRSSTEKVLEFINGLESKPKVYICYPAPIFENKYKRLPESVNGDIIPVLKAVAKEHKLPVIDLYNLLKDDSALLRDGIHPNEVAYEKIAKEIAKALK